jgi:hypothetical protein
LLIINEMLVVKKNVVAGLYTGAHEGGVTRESEWEYTTRKTPTSDEKSRFSS